MEAIPHTAKVVNILKLDGSHDFEKPSCTYSDKET